MKIYEDMNGAYIRISGSHLRNNDFLAGDVCSLIWEVGKLTVINHSAKAKKAEAISGEKSPAYSKELKGGNKQMSITIGKANGRGKCHQCRNTLKKGESVAVVHGYHWASERFCLYCMQDIAEKMQLAAK